MDAWPCVAASRPVGDRVMLEVTIAAQDGRVFRRFELTGRRSICVGRATACDVRIPEPSVSRQHAEIALVADDEWVLRDLDSTHGCLVEGRRVREIPIEPGLRVQIGPAVLQVTDLGRRIGAELDALLDDDGSEASGSPPRIISGGLDDA